MSSSNAQRVTILAAEMKEIVEQLGNKACPNVDKAFTRLAEIKREINSFGFMINGEATIDPKDLSGQRIIVTISVYRPKPNMPPEMQAIYDDWFKKMNGMA